MKKYSIFALFLLVTASFSAQTEILPEYPKNQKPYIGGYQGYYKDFHDIVIEKNLKPCDNKNEFYEFDVLITPDSSVQFIKDLNEKAIQANKCAYDLAREVAKYQKGWNPATVNNVPVNAVAKFIIYPDDFFENYKDGYYPKFTYPVYDNYEKDAFKHFYKEFKNKIFWNKRRFSWNDNFLVMTEFTITQEGKIDKNSIIITKSSGLEEFDKMIISALKDMNKKWKPATINGLPIDYRLKYTLRGITDPDPDNY